MRFTIVMLSMLCLAFSVSAGDANEFDAWKHIALKCQKDDACGDLVNITTVTFEGNEYEAVEIQSPEGPQTVFAVPDMVNRGWALCWRKNYVESSATFYCQLL